MVTKTSHSDHSDIRQDNANLAQIMNNYKRLVRYWRWVQAHDKDACQDPEFVPNLNDMVSLVLDHIDALIKFEKE